MKQLSTKQNTFLITKTYFIILVLFLFGCLQAKKSRFDINSPSGLLFGLVNGNSYSQFISNGTVNSSTPQSNTKDITSYSFLGIAATSSISSNVINLEVPLGTNLSSLVATFTSNGKSVKIGNIDQISGVTANDFSGGIVYTVIAEDSSTKEYQVLVTIQGQVSAPSFNVATGIYSKDQSISLSSATLDANIYFNRGLNPTDPNCSGNGTLYTSPILIDITGTIVKAIACKVGLADSNVSTATYTLKVAQTLVYSNNTFNLLVIPFSFSATTSSVPSITKCLRANGTPACNSDGSCATGSSTTLSYNTNADVTVSAIGCRANYTPSDIDSKTFKVSAIRSADNSYLTIVDASANTNIMNKKVYICSEGETYNTSTGNCSGTPTDFQFCATNDNSCNGGTDTGQAANGSPIFNYCNIRTYGGFAAGTWRAPTLNELTGFFPIYAKNPNGWPSSLGLNYWSNQSVLSGFANEVSNTGPFQTNIYQAQKTTLKNLRCIRN
ncbi:MAG TPA: FN3 associated domain-containing protein [Leptospiraceae bacterium]|nr:FN3 associated domain-containing protein [Leptospiraceae bacterium]HMW04725.1 FN3 associated domain-containing protein [Leptospiraceae bacterium]HMX31756.1 FN3 associated domain-containing protein [Leptospiraceae bacterium]HMY30562.1 FN3 associated domain-containing protein [Leptospiraceae bacterium]HMZ64137.1 FN3 associated domain-containing protein [Leptospiraceae bacterium]